MLSIGAFTNPKLAALAGEPSSSVLVEGHFPVAVTLIVDDVPASRTTEAVTVSDLLSEANVTFDGHDKIEPALDTKLRADDVVRVTHVVSWNEVVGQTIPAPVKNVPSFHVALGKTKVIDPGSDGMKQLSYVVTRGSDRLVTPRRVLLSAKVTRTPRTRVVAHGVGEYALTQLAERGLDATIHFAGAAMQMVATAYTAHCIGCSGYTKLGAPAGHGIVAVDPRVIPLGTALYIPGYGRAIAGDTGGAIRGNRIDLGFNSTSDAFRFGTRPIIVYVLH